MTDEELALSWKLTAETVQRAFDRLQFAASVVVREAESVHYMGRMEVSVEAVHALRAAALIDGSECGPVGSIAPADPHAPS